MAVRSLDDRSTIAKRAAADKAGPALRQPEIGMDAVGRPDDGQVAIRTGGGPPDPPEALAYHQIWEADADVDPPGLSTTNG